MRFSIVSGTRMTKSGPPVRTLSFSGHTHTKIVPLATDTNDESDALGAWADGISDYEGF